MALCDGCGSASFAEIPFFKGIESCVSEDGKVVGDDFCGACSVCGVELCGDSYAICERVRVVGAEQFHVDPKFDFVFFAGLRYGAFIVAHSCGFGVEFAGVVCADAVLHGEMDIFEI